MKTELEAAIDRLKDSIREDSWSPTDMSCSDVEQVIAAATQSLALQQIDKSEVLEQLEALAESLDEQDRITSRNIVHGAISYILALQQANAELLKELETGRETLRQLASLENVNEETRRMLIHLGNTFNAAMSKQVKGEV